MKKDFIITITASMLIFLAVICPMPVYSTSATSMDINNFESTMIVGGTQTINVILYPDDADSAVKYSSSNTAVATVSPGGKISAKSAGRTNIIITAGNISQTLPLTVESVTIEISDFENKMEVDSTQTITVTLHPNNAPDKISYSSSNTSVATISRSGNIEAKSSDNYRLFGELDDASFETDIAGNYRITYEKLKETGPNKIIIGAAATLIAAIVGIYLILRRVL